MLAQNFKTPADLEIADAEFEALVKFLGMLDRGEVRHVRVCDDLYGPGNNDPTPKKFTAMFNMDNVWTSAVGECGTAGCIAGNCDLLFGTKFAPRGDIGNCLPGALVNLFCPSDIRIGQWKNITVEQAAIAVRNYLTHGEARWAEAVSE